MATLKYLADIDLQKNSLNNARIQNLSTAPGSPAEGQIYYDTDTNDLNIYNGSAWVRLGPTGAGDIESVVAGAGMTGGGTSGDVTLNVIGGDGITANANDVAITAAQTTVTSVLNAGLVLGRDADNQIKFATDNQMIFRVGAGDGVTFKASGEIEATKFDGALEGNADTATILATARAINGVDFDGSAAITVTAAGSTLSDTVTVAKGGTGQTSLAANSVLTGNGTSGVVAESNLTYDGTNLSLSASGNSAPDVIINSTANHASSGNLIFNKLRADNTPADNDSIGTISFQGEDDAQNAQVYATISGISEETGSGAEGGQIKFSVASHDGEINQGLLIQDGSAEDEIDVTIGSGAASVTLIAGTLTMGSTAAMTNAGLLSVANQSNITGVGALNGGTITSGFGNIDNGSSTLDTGAATVASLVIGGHSIDDIDITSEFVDANAHIMSSKAIGARFSLKAGSSSVVTTGALNSGSITSGFGTINNGASAITTTGLISGGSLDIDNVLINGANIGHTDDTDLITLADEQVTITGSLVVTGTTTTNNVETVSTSSGVIFEGAAADGHDATLKSVVASSDKTYTLPNTTGFIGIFTTDPGTTNVTATTAELNALDLGSTAVGNAIASKAVVLDSSKDFTGLNSIGSTSFVIGGHTINDVDIAGEFVDSAEHLITSAAALDKFSLIAGSTSITTLGTIGTGVWNGTVIATSKTAAKVTSIVAGAGIDVNNSGVGDVTVTAETASATNPGIVELATTAEALAGSDTTRAVTAAGLAARSYKEIIGDGSATAFNVDHGLATRDVIVQLYDASSYDTVYAQIVRTTADRVVATFNTAPGNDDIIILITKVD
jgi:hypothetical protein